MLGRVVLAALLTACSDGEGGPEPAADWAAFRPPAPFEFRGPPDLVPVPAQPIDSRAGRYASASLDLAYDYGPHADPLEDPDGEGVASESALIDGRRARIVRTPQRAAVHFPELAGGMKLTVSVALRTPAAASDAMAIFHSIRFR